MPNNRRLVVGDTYICENTEHDGNTPHDGHRARVTSVKIPPVSTGPDPEDGGPNIVTVLCSCGDTWEFEDRDG